MKVQLFTKNPDVLFASNGNLIIDAQQTRTPVEATMFIIPGRIPILAERTLAIPRPELEVYTGVFSPYSDNISMKKLTSISLSPGETPPAPHLVLARTATIIAPGQELSNEAKRIKMAQTLLRL